MMLEQAAGREILAAWGGFLLVALGVLFWYLSRKVDRRSVRFVLMGMILVVAVGPFVLHLGYYVPGMTHRMERLEGERARKEAESRKERDIALADRRENTVLKQTVRDLRERVSELEERIARQDPVRPAAEATGEPPEAMTQEERWMQPRASNARYQVTIVTPESNVPFADTLAELLKHLRFQTGEPLFLEVERNRVVYHSEADFRRAAYLVWLLEYKFKMDVPMERIPHERQQGRMQIYLEP